MAIIKTDDSHYKAIANAIRLFSDSGSTYKPSEMAYGVREAYERGIELGGNDGYNEGYSVGMGEGFNIGLEQGHQEGKQAEYDAFWDEFQNSGGEASYYYAFAYGRFTDENYNPKYDIVCTSNATASSQYIFNAASGIIDTKVAIYANGRQATGMFNGCTALKRIPLLVVHEDLTYSNAFKGCTALEDITIEGIIGKAIDFSDCVLLSRGSFESIIAALSDETSGLEARFSNSALMRAFENLDDWTALIENKTNWVISLV